MSSNLGLKEIRFINSGDFTHEIVNIETSTLLLGSSGVGKTTIMSAVCYFYTMDKDRTRPDNQDKSFYQWHLPSVYSHVIYRYTSIAGENLLILSLENGKPKHTFVNIHTYEKEIETLYFDDENTPLELKEILQKCTSDFLPYQKCETFTTFKKLLHKSEYRTLKEKDRPTLDFSLFKDSENSKIFSEHLFKIYKSSSIQDSTIKNMLISLIESNENVFDVLDFRQKLESSLESVEQIELIKSKRSKIMEIDEIINAYKRLLLKQERISEKINEVRANQRNIEEYLKRDLEDFVEKSQIEKDALEESKTKRKNLNSEYDGKIAELNYVIKDLQKRSQEFLKKDIESKIEEESREGEYSLEKEKLEARAKALSSELKDLKEVEKQQKRSVELDLLDKKESEKTALDSLIAELNEKLINLFEESKLELEKTLAPLHEQLEISVEKLKEEEKELLTLQTKLEYLPKQEITNRTIETLKGRLQELEKEINEQKQQFRSLEDSIASKKEHLANEQERIHNQKESEKEEYNKEKEKLEEAIKDVNSKLNFDKDNLYGYLNQKEHPYKKEILAVTKDELLFKEGLSFSSSEGKSLYGINIADVKTLSNDYDVHFLESQKSTLTHKRDTLVAEYKQKDRRLDNRVKEIERSSVKEIKELTREKLKLDNQLSSNRSNLENKSVELQQELDLEKEKLKQEVTNLKELINSKKESITLIKQRSTIEQDLINEKKDSLETEVNKQKTQLQSTLAEKKQEIKTLNSRYQKLIEQKHKEIENEFLKVLSEQNIDPSEINSLERKIKTVERKLEEINKNRSHVEEYKRFKPEFDSLEEKQDSLESLKRSKEQYDNQYEREIKDLKNQLKKSQEKITNIKGKMDKFSQFIREISTLLFNSSSIGEIYNEDEIALMVERDFFSKLLKDLDEVKRDLTNRSQEIRNKTESLTRGVPQNNILNLRTCVMDLVESDSIDSYISIANDYILYIKEKLDIQGASLQLRGLIETINGAVSQIRHIEEDANIIASEVNKINSMLRRGVADIRVIDNIHLNYYAYTSDEVLNQIKEIGTLLEKELVVLFHSDEKSERAKEKILQEAGNLKELLSKDFKKSFSISEMSKLSFDISENQKLHKNLATLNTIGSNGTTIMVKTIIYLTLLKRVSLKFDADLKLHCILDEIGQISADYFSELLKYADSLNFSFLNGTAANDDDMIYCYQNIYTGIRNGNKTEILRFVVEDILED